MNYLEQKQLLGSVFPSLTLDPLPLITGAIHSNGVETHLGPEVKGQPRRKAATVNRSDVGSCGRAFMSLPPSLPSCSGSPPEVTVPLR